MNYVFDPAKNDANIVKHGLSLAAVADFDFLTAAIEVDDRQDYGEIRFRAFNRIGSEGYCLVFTVRGTTARAISFRRAHDREMRRHGR